MNVTITLKKLRSIHPIQDLWFKPRTILQIERETYEYRELEHNEYDVEWYAGKQSLNSIDAETGEFLKRHVGRQRANHRLEDEDCVLFLVRVKDDGTPVGFYWSVGADSEPVWHDSYKVQVGTALVFNAYVVEDHRRRGVYRLLQSASHNYLFANTECEVVTTIVENRNNASMQANRKFGLQPVADNYLIKFLSINIISIIREDMTRFLFVLTRGGL